MPRRAIKMSAIRVFTDDQEWVAWKIDQSDRKPPATAALHVSQSGPSSSALEEAIASTISSSASVSRASQLEPACIKISAPLPDVPLRSFAFALAAR